ncbi:hypothetical protein P7K49_001365 [Saguinus oedipus]|uniref:Clathrin light chain n=1 Tax=Saguinus oedipus TaxID=9490 RepID=A0ABQ9WG60_SAGOE|nr:hypothetical protein P7K49_001365 [Saguinus oedipus]
MTELDPFGAPAGAPGGPALGNGVAGAGEEDPAAAFLAQQESEIAGIENDEAFAILDGGAPGPQPHGEPPGGPGKNAGAFGARGLVWKLGLKWARELLRLRGSTKRKRDPGPVMQKPRLEKPVRFSVCECFWARVERESKYRVADSGA